MKIRQAEESDFDEVLRLGNEMATESETRFPSVDAAWAEDMFTYCIENQDICIFLVSEENDALEGFLLAWVSKTVWSPQKRASIELLFVQKDRRSLATASALMRRYEAEARHRGVRKDDIWLCVSTGQELGALAKLWGYEYKGGNYQKCAAAVV